MFNQLARLPRAVVVPVLLLLALSAPRSGFAAEWIVITPARFAAEFQRLAEHRAATGLTAAVVTLESVWAQDPAGGDPPARLREYLRRAYAGGTRYVLLGGDGRVLPARRVSWNFPHYDGQSDLYLVCFDGEWDDDGDGVYDDFFPGMDLVPELAIGRAPVSDVTQARVFVDKVLAWEASASEPYRRRALCVDVVLMPHPWLPGYPVQFDMARIAEEQVLPIFAAVPGDFEVVRLYQNHAAYSGALPLTTAAMLEQLATGNYGLIQVGCRANLGLWELGFDGKALDNMSREDAKDLTTAGRGFFLQTIAPFAAAHGDSSGLIVPLLQSPVGGGVGAVGFASLGGIYSACALQRAFWAAALDDAPRAGDAWAAAVAASAGGHRWSVVIFTLLGDPALGLQPAAPREDPVSVSALSAAPNPFNPSTRLRFELPDRGPVRLEVFDLAGRRVAVLLDAILPPGPHEAVWRGRDDASAPVAAGMYIVRLTIPAGTSMQRLMLVK